jgi:acyl carrier protein
MKKKYFINSLAELLEIDPSILTDDFSLVNCFTWDSLAQVSTLGLIAEYFNVNANIVIIEQVKTVKDLFDIINFLLNKNK